MTRRLTSHLMLSRAFSDELQKIAANVIGLNRKLKRVKNLHFGPGELMKHPGGASVIPPTRIMKALAKKKRAGRGGTVDQASPFFGPAADQKMVDLLKPYAGRIEVDPEAVNRTLARAAGIKPSESKVDKAALGVVSALHELAERGTKVKDVNPLYSHAKADVLVQELNALNKLRGPGSAYAKKAVRGARAATGEYDHIRSLVEMAFGPRALAFLRDGEKVPSAMRKKLNEMIRRDPALLDRALKASKRKRGVVGEFKRRRTLNRRMKSVINPE